MGGSQTKAKSTTQILNENMVNITQSVVNSCTAMTTQEILLDLSKNVGIVDLSGSTFKQGAVVRLSCALEDKRKNDIATKISNYLKQVAESQGALLKFGKNKTEADANIQNRVSVAINGITQNTVAASVQQKFGINAYENKGIIFMRNITVEQSAEAVAQSIVDVVNQTGITADLATTVDQLARTEDKGPFDNLFAGLSNLFIYIIIFIAFIILAIVGTIVYSVVYRNTNR
jgi:hypothetical protein